MTLEQMAIVSLLPILAVAVWSLVRKVDRDNPYAKHDHVNHSQRRIRHNGFKSRQGIRDRRCV